MAAEPERWTLLADGERSDKRVPVGVCGWTLPAWFGRTLDHSSEPFHLHLECKFAGRRVEVVAVAVRSRNGRTITPRDLSAVELARAVYLLTDSELRPEEARHHERRPNRQLDEAELHLLASIYAFQFAAWGNPRQAVMGLWELPRATASRWIRKARARFPDAVPGDGGDGDG